MIKYIIKFILALFLVNLFWYIIGVFIAQSYDPTNWWLFTTIVGRVFFVIIEIGFFKMAMGAATESD